jgi:hypothetical protein
MTTSPTPPQATYTITVPITLDNVTAPLQIHAVSMNELKRAVRLLKENGLLVEMAPEPTNGDTPVCHVHKTKMKPSQYGGWFCPVKDASGSYCKVKQT